MILCTGISERLEERRSTLKGVKGILLKPIVMDDLAQMVRQVLDEAKTGVP